LIGAQTLTNGCHRCRIELADFITVQIKQVNFIFLKQPQERFTIGFVLPIGEHDEKHADEKSQGREKQRQGKTFQGYKGKGYQPLPYR
jgi:hypothetical protein